MKKIIAFLTAVVLFIPTVFMLNAYYAGQIAKAGDSLCYVYASEKNNSPEAIARVLDEETVLLLGSSELPYYNEKSHPMVVTNNGNSDFNIMELGVAYNQSLSHAINAGALAPYIENKKIVLNLSPQWFTSEHLAPEAFASVFSDRMFELFMSNTGISSETKQKVVERCKQLMSTNERGINLIKDYEELYLKGKTRDVIKEISVNISEFKNRIQSQKKLLQLLPIDKLSKTEVDHAKTKKVKFAEINFQQLMDVSAEQGKAQCTNNDFYINSSYWEQYIAPVLQERKNSQKNMSYCHSPEYDDLKLFLTVCDEVGLDVMLINIPVHGYWYDYTGFSKEDRERYYQKIRNIADDYDAEILDLSMHEYTPYFLKDIMHLGWKGWVYLDEGIYNFYKENS